MSHLIRISLPIRPGEELSIGLGDLAFVDEPIEPLGPVIEGLGGSEPPTLPDFAPSRGKGPLTGVEPA